jgi:hypothetical protein
MGAGLTESQAATVLENNEALLNTSKRRLGA